MPENSGGHFLAVRLGSLGDIVHTVPAVAALRCSFPDARIDWVVERKWAPLVDMVGSVNAVIPLDRTLAGNLACIRLLRRSAHTCTIDFQGLYKSAILGWCTRARRRVGFAGTVAREPGAARFYNEAVAPTGRHVAELNMSLAVRAGAVAPPEMQFPLVVPEPAAAQVRQILQGQGIQEYAVVSPGGGWASKLWPAKRYGELCAELWRRHGIRAIVNTGPAEMGLARETAAYADTSQPMALSLPIPELAALLAGASVVVAADSGPLHLAAALGTRVVGLFGPTDPARNGPLRHGTVIRNLASARTTYQRGPVHSAAMLSISVEQVREAVERVMESAAAG